MQAEFVDRGLRSTPRLNSGEMNRWLVIALLFLLPLQFSWAAAERYCLDEGEPAAHRHLGHHSHHPEAEDDGGSESQSTQPNTPEHGCAGCHLGCAAVPTDDVRTTNVAASHWHSSDYASRLFPAPSKRPDRPQWPTLA